MLIFKQSFKVWNQILSVNKKLILTLMILPLILSSLNNIPVRATGGLTKTGYDTTTQSTTTTKQGGEVQWVNSFNNETTSPVLTTITDPILANQTYQPGSLQTPPGWTKEYSTDNGASFSTTEPASGVNAVQTKGLTVPGNSNAVEKQLPVPTLPFASGASGGDGWRAILYSSNDGLKNYVCAVYHHWPYTFDNSPKHSNINCLDKFTGTTIVGYPKYFSSTTGVDTAGVGDLTSSPQADIATPYAMTEGRIGTKLYTPAQRPNDGGISCWDFAIDQNCGYIKLNDLPHDNVGQVP